MMLLEQEKETPEDIIPFDDKPISSRKPPSQRRLTINPAIPSSILRLILQKMPPFVSERMPLRTTFFSTSPKKNNKLKTPLSFLRAIAIQK
jgi:hypothetical protein